jgi:drug/metabolite transporter (DMT)-like permease
MRPVVKAQLQIQACVVLWGFTSILGKLITLPALALVWWRMLLVVVALLLSPRVWRGLLGMRGRLVLAYAGIGVLVTLHWLAFYGSIKLANASVAATCLALGPIFLALMEPLIVRRPFDPLELLFGIAVVPGVGLVVGGIPAAMRVGVLVGALSALLAALFNALNKRLIQGADPLTVTCLELGTGTLLLSLLVSLPLCVAGLSIRIPDAHDALLLVILAMGCTLLPFTLSLVALRHLTAYSAQLAVNLEPVYAIVLAVLLLGEQHELGASFYAGVAIILGVSYAHYRGRYAR